MHKVVLLGLHTLSPLVGWSYSYIAAVCSVIVVSFPAWRINILFPSDAVHAYTLISSMNRGPQTALASSPPHSSAEKHSLSSRYLSDKHAAGHKLPVTCLIGIHLSAEDCLCNRVLYVCVCVCRDRDRSRSAADEWEVSTAAERRCNELTGSLCAAGRIQVKKRCFKISYLCSPFWCYDLFQYGRKIGEELELIFQRRKKKKKNNFFHSSELQVLSKSCTGIKWKIWESVAVVWACISWQTSALGIDSLE